MTKWQRGRHQRAPRPLAFRPPRERKFSLGQTLPTKSLSPSSHPLSHTYVHTIYDNSDLRAVFNIFESAISKAPESSSSSSRSTLRERERERERSAGREKFALCSIYSAMASRRAANFWLLLFVSPPPPLRRRRRGRGAAAAGGEGEEDACFIFVAVHERFLFIFYPRIPEHKYILSSLKFRCAAFLYFREE